ncbi:MAG: NAD(P)/FAD-dependent oxidoreductase [Cyanothece sp. SIO2G6]|nr:NAD(P)/FAD-dependent oxidoreductase [Cyanothece sp. SIO2G6]
MKKIIGIIGGGPAGMSCALWLKHLGFQPIIFEQNAQLGGLQTINPFYNKWYLGVMGQTGMALAQQFQRHMEIESIPRLFNVSMQKIISVDGERWFHLFTADHDVVVDGLVIATGQRFRGPEAIASISDRQLLNASAQVDFNPGYIPQTHGKVVAVIGGGDNGLGTAQMLAATAKHVYLFIRSEMQGFGINQQAIANAVQSGQITLHQPTSIQRFEQTDQGIAIHFSQTGTPATDTPAKQILVVDYIAFRLGFAPNVEAIASCLTTTGLTLKCLPSGHIDTDEFMRTSIPKIYAIGDVTKPRDPCVATAVAHGAIAARSIDEDFKMLD